METNSIVFFKQQPVPPLPSKPIIAAWQVKTPGNIGSLLRLADNIGAEKVFIIDNDQEKRLSAIKKTAGISFNRVALQFVAPEIFLTQIPEGYQLVAIETSSNAENIYRAKLPAKAVFLLGSEKHGIPPEQIAQCHQTVFIPMPGQCKSMNISHALSVALFEWQRQMVFSEQY